MRSTYKQLYYINRSKVKSDGTTSIMCRITIDGKAVVLSTGLYCQPEEWNSKKGEVKNNRLNGMLDEHKKRVDETYAELLKVNGVISAELLKTAMTGAADIPKYILQAVERDCLDYLPYTHKIHSLILFISVWIVLPLFPIYLLIRYIKYKLL